MGEILSEANYIYTWLILERESRTDLMDGVRFVVELSTYNSHQACEVEDLWSKEQAAEAVPHKTTNLPTRPKANPRNEALRSNYHRSCRIGICSYAYALGNSTQKHSA